MSQLLDRAVGEARKLSDAEQDAIAALILAEIEDDRRWAESLARSPGKLAALVARAEEQVRAGHCRTAAFERRVPYSEGVASHSPGLPAAAGYPGTTDASAIYPERVASVEYGR